MSLAQADPVTCSARPNRSALMGALAALGLGELLLCGLLAGLIDRLASGSEGVLLPLLAAAGIAAMSGAGLLLLVWMAEDFAQSCAGAQAECAA